MERGGWWSTVQGVPGSWIWLGTCAAFYQVERVLELSQMLFLGYNPQFDSNKKSTSFLDRLFCWQCYTLVKVLSSNWCSVIYIETHFILSAAIKSGQVIGTESKAATLETITFWCGHSLYSTLIANICHFTVYWLVVLRCLLRHELSSVCQ